ncbi:substrate-binding periplasmic protein [Algirhabdus cladophorae]|uniref:substrate-binding periplasmic protein n=1 Tax=Algirhabdus cladophorae TaxID=3377108 RepID=UPI003B849BD6
MFEIGLRKTVALAALMGLMFSAHSAAARSLDEILASGVLRACVPTANPPDGEVIPAGCKGYCQYEGIIGDLVETFAADMELTPEYYVQSWDELFQNAKGVTVKEDTYTPVALETLQCDMIGAVMVSLDWRLKKMDMECFLPSRMMVVSHRDRQAEFTTLDDLAGRTVAVEQSMYLHTWIEEQNEGALKDKPIEILFRPYDQTIPTVEKGDADFTVVSVLDALYQTRRTSPDAVAAFAVGPFNEGCWGYRSGDTEMGAQIKSFFAEQTIEPSSELNELWNTYYGMSFSDFIRLVSAIE